MASSSEHEASQTTHLFYPDGIDDDLLHSLLRRFVYQVFEHQAGKVAVQALEEKVERQYKIRRPPSLMHNWKQLYLFLHYSLYILLGHTKSTY